MLGAGAAAGAAPKGRLNFLSPWHVQLNTNLAIIAALKDLVAAPVPVVFDHFGGAKAALGLQQPGFADLVELVRSGKAYVKISAAYRVSQQAPDYPDVVPLAQALIAANAERILWGTDWPHPTGPPPGASRRMSPLCSRLMTAGC
jgi:predicted TIM-barrel fold metal-dependent hydrolase